MNGTQLPVPGIFSGSPAHTRWCSNISDWRGIVKYLVGGGSSSSGQTQGLRPPTPLSPPPTAAHVQTRPRQREWRDGTHTSTPFLAAVSATIGCTGSVWVQPRMHPSTQLAMIRAADSMPIISGRCRRKCSARGRNSLHVHTRHRGQPTPGATTAVITTPPATSRTLQACRCRSRRCPSR